MSGWDKAPDYGGPPWRWWTYVWTIAVVLLVAFGIAYYSSQPAQTEMPPKTSPPIEEGGI